MKVLLCSSECVPFAKTGGLADVVGALPKALCRQGVDARVILPKYTLIPSRYQDEMEHICDFTVLMGESRLFCGIDSLVLGNVRFYFVDNLAVFGGDRLYSGNEDEGYRFAFYCRAVLEALPRIGFFPDVLHLNDWQSGLIAALLCGQYRHLEHYRDIRTVYTIHNLRYQGLFPWRLISGITGLDDSWFDSERLEFYGLCSLMKAGIVFADRVTTVSPTYAEEICGSYYGERLDGLLQKYRCKLSGILNGIDYEIYNPENDSYLPEAFGTGDLSGKRRLKSILQRELGLAQRRDVPLIGFIARLYSQKGLDLIECVLEDIMEDEVQLCFLGLGDRRYEDMLYAASERYRGRIALRTELNEGLAHLIYGGADMFLMPSQFEPCGLSQMIALRYGTIPIVRETGGLADSVIPYNKYTDEGTGFSFRNYNAHEMLYTIQRACKYQREQKELWQRLMLRAMTAKLDWEASARSYEELYSEVLEV